MHRVSKTEAEARVQLMKQFVDSVLERTEGMELESVVIFLLSFPSSGSVAAHKADDKVAQLLVEGFERLLTSVIVDMFKLAGYKPHEVRQLIRNKMQWAEEEALKECKKES